MKVPHPIPYQGSKRNLATRILSFVPSDTKTLIEPFAGSAAISIAAALKKKSQRFHLNDVNKPLMELWKAIIQSPEELSKQYSKLWRAQQENPREFYDSVREKFNKTKRPDYLLYLLARCVKAAVRYNFDGEFNQSPDNRRLGRNPAMMSHDIMATSNLLKSFTSITCRDYREVLSLATRNDLVYMDPPYQGTFASGGFRYYQDLEFEHFIESLRELKKNQISFIVSYDGRTGDKTFGLPIPTDLELMRIELKAGRSSQATLLGRNHITYEAIYLSKALTKRLNLGIRKTFPSIIFSKQMEMFTVLSE